MSTLSIKDLSVEYGDFVAIKDLNLEIQPNRLTVILGPSGCGKSTLLSSICGLVRPKRGCIYYEDECLFSQEDQINIPVERRNIGVVFQENSLWPHMNIRGNIAFPLKMKRVSKDEINRKVDQVIETVNLKEKGLKYPHQLSGGEKQRTALARAIAMNPKVLLLDEPLANIDNNLKYQLIYEIKRIQKLYKTTMVYVTHDQEEAFEAADEIVVMNKGEIIQKGKPEEVYYYPNNSFVAGFLGENNILSLDEGEKYCALCHNDWGKMSSKIAVRPEDILIKKEGKCKGKVKNITFKGHKTNIITQCGEKQLTLYHENSQKIKVGDEIQFDIKRYHLIK